MKKLLHTKTKNTVQNVTPEKQAYDAGFEDGQQLTSVFIWIGLLAIGIFASIFAFRMIVDMVDDRTIIKKVNVCRIPKTEPTPGMVEGEVYLL